MKIKLAWLWFGLLMPTALFAHWQPVGSAEYTWGPFHVYTIGLYSETGRYQENTTPLMFSFKYEKPIEGKNFAISLIKEIDAVNITDGDSKQWLKSLQQVFPDFAPNDVLNYIALADRGYFVLNDTVLDHEFDSKFNQAFIQIWLSPKSGFAGLRPQLLGETESGHKPEEFNLHPSTEPLDEDSANPELPPNYQLENRTFDKG